MRYVATLLMFLTLAMASPDASAQPFPRQNGGQEMQSLNSIIGNIRRQFPGQLSDVEGPRNGQYLIKWLTPDGVILLIVADARTGQILGVQGGGNLQRQNYDSSPAYLPRGESLDRRGYGNRRLWRQGR